MRLVVKLLEPLVALVTTHKKTDLDASSGADLGSLQQCSVQPWLVERRPL